MIIEWSLNGRPLRSEVSPFRKLLDYLRQDLKLLGAKEGCREGKCGACTIWIDGQVANSCLVLMGQLSGKEVTTIEGINEKDKFTPLQESLLTASAIECGFCIPGMLMSGTVLLNQNPDPSRLQIRETLKGHLCACTGYQKIIDAIEGVGLPPAVDGRARMRARR
jgi:aerobic-type carbon monoxide dehydrogenase small subunit (CoxS/CutS family)